MPQVVSVTLQVHATIICSCRQGVVVITDVSHIAACARCKQEYAVDRIALDRVAAFRDHETAPANAEINVASRAPLIVSPAIQ